MAGNLLGTIKLPISLRRSRHRIATPRQFRKLQHLSPIPDYFLRIALFSFLLVSIDLIIEFRPVRGWFSSPNEDVRLLPRAHWLLEGQSSQVRRVGHPKWRRSSAISLSSPRLSGQDRGQWPSPSTTAFPALTRRLQNASAGRAHQHFPSIPQNR